MLRPLLVTWYECAQKLGDVELSVRLLVEMIGYGQSDISVLTYARHVKMFAQASTRIRSQVHCRRIY